VKPLLKKLLPEESFLVQTGAIFFIGFCVRLVYLYLTDARGGYDTLDYLKLADNLYNFGVYSLNDFPDFIPSVRRAPAYPYFLAFFQWLGGGKFSFQSVAFIQSALDALTAAAIFLLARKVVSNPLAVAAAVFYALHPGAIFRSRLILTECLFTFLLVVSVLLLIDAVEKERIWLLILAGFLLALGVLTRPLAVIVPGLFVFTVWLKSESKRKYKLMTIFGVVFFVTLAPWLYRCYAVSGQFVFVQGVTAFQFYAPTRVDLPPWDEKKLWSEYFDPHTEDEYFRKLAAARTPADFIEAEKIGRQKAIENIKAHPNEYLLSRIKTYPYFFITGFDNFTGINKSYGTLFAEGSFFVLLIKILFLLVFSLLPLVLSLAGLLRAGRNLTTAFCASIWVVVLLIHLPMWIEYRFWLPFLPFQIITAAAGFALFRDRFFPQKPAAS
jgi:4-amino-4-deoxy-L-arabinose transferase-like glycosyltransferase